MIDKFNADRSKGVHNLNLFQDHYEPHLRQSALGMASLEHIDEKSLPDNMLNRFVNKDSSKYLLTLYPKESVWNLSFLERFTFQMKKFDERITGFPGVFFVLTHIIGKDRKIDATLTIIVVFLLLLWDFKKLRLAIMAMVPLVIGTFWMVGTMHLFGLQLTLVNLMGIPLILGIGIDDGVHILQLWLI